MSTYVFNRDPELGSEPAGCFEADGLTYVTVLDGELDAAVEPNGTLSYPCGCDATVSCPACV